MVGYILLILFGTHGILGAWLSRVFDVQLIFTRTAQPLPLQ